MTYSPFPATICRLLLSIMAVAATNCGSGRVVAAEPAAEGFGPVRKLMETRCLSCHNDHDREGDFSLQSQDGFLSGDYVIPGNARDSHILQLIVSQDGAAPEMPKEGNPLTPDEVALFTKWIGAGAVWPEAVTLTPPAVDDFDWWSFQPVDRPPVPVVAGSESGWIRTPIDAFIQAQHHRLGLTPAPDADRRTLIRRLTYDLTGLPPTPEQIHRFVADSRPEAYAELVDRLLMSPRYGERWARHWLDVVRYADTCGYDKDKLRPNAWPYRDYVIRAFNDDKPYSRFVQEQVAGDVLYPGEPDGILGLGFIAAGPWDFIGHVEVPESKLDGRVARNLDRDEMVTNTLNAFCSVTIQCARCHNHKFDPFRQEHYYSLQSVFAAVDRAERPYDTEPEVERKRQQLTDRRDQLVAELKKFDDDVKKEGGAELSELNGLVAELKPRAVPADKRSEFGYHSAIAATANTEKWVEVDLGQEFDIAQVILHPCHDDFAGIGAGFGFPVRFRIDARADQDVVDSARSPDDASGAADGQQTTFVCVGDFSQADYANPGLAAVPVTALGTRARFIRLTATQLAERSNDFILAIAELEVLSTDGKNVARGAHVQALDSIEAPTRWRKSNLTDGIWVKAADPEAVTALTQAAARRTELLSTILTPDRVARRQQLLQERDEVERQRNALPQGRMVYAAATRFAVQGNFKPTDGVPRDVRVLYRGDIQQPRDEVQPGTVPLSLADAWRFDLPEGHSEGERRAALARWITDEGNPLTWRSIANRIWQYHFGRGLADSPNDLGRMGQRPTHPELLDWLADEFRRTQSFKHMHRLICNSATYRQASFHTANHADIDGDNQFLWRMNRRRLSAEELRDSVLAVSGKLNLKMGGPGFYLFALEKTAHSPHYEYHKFDPDDAASHRRSVYRFIVRSQPDPFMTTLDCADSSQSTPRRTETLTSLQALSLLNNKFNLTMARHFANRVSVEAGQVSSTARAFELVTGRQPTVSEQEQLDDYAREHGLPNVCRVLLNLSEFVYLD